ncbi:MAG: arginyltransferase [Thermodesulfobacteriota bacterium]
MEATGIGETGIDRHQVAGLLARLDGCFTDLASECPYGLGRVAVYHQAAFPALPVTVFDGFLDAGYRRNGNVLYTMRCPDCDGCVPIRLETANFMTSSNMRRVWRRNQDLTVGVGPVEISQEKLTLCDRFLAGRHPGRPASALDYYAGFFANSMGVTLEITFRLEGRLVGCSIVDCTPWSLSAVYFYFDPDLRNRSLGTFNILYLAELARAKEMSCLYLGYWIEEVAAMRYKSRFRPHFLLRQGQWRRVD